MRHVRMLACAFLLFVGDSIAAAQHKKTHFRHHPQQTLIMIDPGHGGKDLGAHQECQPCYQEKVLALDTAHKLRQALALMGYRTLMTRKDDRFIELEARAKIASDHKSDLFVSVHYNTAPVESAEGVEVYYYNTDKDKKRSLVSKALAKDVLDGFLEETDAKSRGVKHGNFAVIRETKMAAILVEGGFLSNAKERDKILDATYRKKIADGIASGLDRFLRRKSE